MLNQAKREEQQQKLLEMAEAKERQEVAEERASRLRVKGRDGDEVSMRTGVLETFAGDFVQTHIGAYVESSRSSAAASKGSTEAGGGGKYANDVGTLMLGNPKAAALGLQSMLKIDMSQL